MTITQKAYLLFLKAPRLTDMGLLIELERQETVIGSGGQAHVLLEDTGIDAAHARIAALGDARFQLQALVDEGVSLNGLMARAAPLYDGDLLFFGSSTVLKFATMDPVEVQYHRQMRQMRAPNFR